MPVPVPEPWSLEEPDFDEIEIGSAAKKRICRIRQRGDENQVAAERSVNEHI